MVEEKLIGALREVPWFQTLDPDHFDKMAALASEVSWKAGESIFREGDLCGSMYMILEGHVALSIFVPGHGRVTILTLGSREVFGWSGVTPIAGTRTASAHATRATRAIAFDCAALREACDQDPILGYLVYRRLANVIAGRLTATRLQLLNMYAIGRE